MMSWHAPVNHKAIRKQSRQFSGTPVENQPSVLSRLNIQNSAPFRMTRKLETIALSQPAAYGRLVAEILVVEVALEELFFSRNHNHRDEPNSRHERYDEPKIIQPN